MKHLDVTHAFACEIRTQPYSTRCTCGVRSNASKHPLTPSQEDSK